MKGEDTVAIVAKRGRPKKENAGERRIRVTDTTFAFLLELGDGYPSIGFNKILAHYQNCPMIGDNANGK